MISTIETISATYEKQHEVRVVPSPEHCPNNHYSIVIYYGKNPGFEGFKSIFSKLTECASKNNSIEIKNLNSNAIIEIKKNKKINSVEI